MRDSDYILLVEDDYLDQKSLRRAMRDINVSNPLIVHENGKDALCFLRQEKESVPALIILDLNMPQMNGIEFLNIIKADEKYKKIPVVVLTTSDEKKDRVQCFESGVAGYMKKPVEYFQFVDVVKTIFNYWHLSLTP